MVKKFEMWLKKNWIFAIIAVLFVGLMAVIVGLDFYNQPAADDFGHVVRIREALNGEEPTPINLVGAGIELGKDTYQATQGTWFSDVLFFVSPFAISVTAYKISVFVLQAIWVLSIFFLSHSLKKIKLLTKKQANIAAMGFTILSVSFMFSIGEGLFWYTGIIMYLLPFAMSLYLLGLTLRYIYNPRIVSLIITAILAFLVGGTSFVTGIFIGIVLFALTIRAFVKKDNSRYGLLAIFVAFAIGFGINVFAPGNINRTAAKDLPFIQHILKTFYISIFLGFRSICNTLLYTPLIPLTILLIPTMFNIAKKTNYSFKYKLLVPILLIVAFILQYTPMAYALGNFYEEYRVKNIQYFYFILIFEFAVFYVVGYLTNQKVKVQSRECYISGLIILFCALMTMNLEGTAGITMLYDLGFGTASHYDACVSDLYKSISESPEEVVTIVECTEQPKSYHIPTLVSDTGEYSWIVSRMEAYFNKELIIEKP